MTIITTDNNKIFQLKCNTALEVETQVQFLLLALLVGELLEPEVINTQILNRIEVMLLDLTLGLALKGGMTVMLEVQVEDVVKALAGDSQHDPAFVGAIAEANAALKDGTSKDYISDFVKAYQRLSNGGSLAAIFVSPDRKDITLESSDADVEKILKKETDAAIAASFNVLRSVSTISALRSPTSCVCPTRTVFWSSCRA